MEVLLFQLAIFGTFIALGLFVGGYVERRHLADLDRREQDSQSVLCTQIKSFPYSDATKPPMMLCSEVVISSDYLKTLMAFIRKIFGGELRSFQSLIDRARREALQRLREQAAEQGYDAICNIRIETAAIAGKGAGGKDKVMMSAILASGTGYCRSSV